MVLNEIIEFRDKTHRSTKKSQSSLWVGGTQDLFLYLKQTLADKIKGH